jgi:hypothetical protein
MRQLNGQDASMLYAETRTTPNHVASVEMYNAATAIGGVVTHDDILTHLSERLPEAPTPKSRPSSTSPKASRSLPQPRMNRR